MPLHIAIEAEELAEVVHPEARGVAPAGSDAPIEALEKAAALDEARALKDFERADGLRAELQADGWTVETGPKGTSIRR